MEGCSSKGRGENVVTCRPQGKADRDLTTQLSQEAC